MKHILTRALPVALMSLAVGATALAAANADGPAAAEETPGAPRITAWPADPTTIDAATFAFHADEAGVSFQCRLGEAAFVRCSSPVSFRKLGLGAQRFEVRTVSAAGEASPAKSYRWTVQRTVKTFAVTGDVTGKLTPGSTSPVNIAISNPYRFDLVVREIVVTPKAATTRDGKPNPGCDGRVNLRATPYRGSPVTVKPNQTVTLSGLGVDRARWPQLHMPAAPGGEDPCLGARFAFTYRAKASKK